MTAYYADTSALTSAYLADEDAHEELAELLLSGRHLVLTSYLTRVEFASAITSAKRAGRILDPEPVLEQFDDNAAPGCELGLIPLQADVIMPAARRLVMDNYPLRTLDAIHIAVAMHSTAELTGGAEVTFVTRDDRQADAAKGQGFELR